MLDTNILGGDLSAIIDVPNLVQDIHHLLEGFTVYTMLKQHFSLSYVRHKHPGGGFISNLGTSMIADKSPPQDVCV